MLTLALVSAFIMVKLISSCNEGYFLEENNRCSKCRDQCIVCKSKDHCSSCTDGYWGVTCELLCSRCQSGTSCEKTNGFCFYKCKEGYTGILCDAVCNEKCLSCDRMNAGICENCQPGLYGMSCDKPCPRTCYEKTCDRQNGTCLHGCEGNYSGPYCEILLRDGISPSNWMENKEENSAGYVGTQHKDKADDGGLAENRNTIHFSWIIVILVLIMGFASFIWSVFVVFFVTRSGRCTSPLYLEKSQDLSVSPEKSDKFHKELIYAQAYEVGRNAKVKKKLLLDEELQETKEKHSYI